MSRITSRPRLLLAIAIGLAMLLLAETVVLAANTKSGGPVKAVKVATEPGTATISSNAFTDIPGMSVSMTVPSGEKALLLITFSADAYCHDDLGSTALCYVRVLVDGTTQALPGQLVFDSAADGNVAFPDEANSMQFVVAPISAGAHTVKVQAYVDEVYSVFVIERRTLSVLRSKV